MKHTADLASTAQPFSIDDPALHQTLAERIGDALEAIDNGAPRPALAGLAALPQEIAALAYEMLLFARFPDGSGDTADLDDATILALTMLTGAAAGREAALALLDGETRQRNAAAFLAGAFAARSVLAGHVAGIADLWPAFDTAVWPTLADAEARIATHPLDIAAHRARVRHLANAGELHPALDALTTAMSLPLGFNEKGGLGTELAVLVPVLLSNGLAEAVGAWRARLALGANAAVAGYAARLLPDLSAVHAAALPDAIAVATQLFADFAQPTPSLVATYPTRNGKPHVNMLFLEVTNYCNQKCTFCPDMHRETARTFLPVAQVKALIDEIADKLSLNMLALNAYGEPLLHPDIDQILEHVRSKNMSWPVYFTTHGMTLVDKKLKQLSNNYPRGGIAVSLHNDNQESYAATRSAKIGDYDTLFTRVSNLARQMVNERAPAHLRLYQMANNGHEDLQVPPEVRAAFPSDANRVMIHVRKWEAVAADIAANAPPEAHARAFVNEPEFIERAFRDAINDHGVPMPLVEWIDVDGNLQQVCMSCRPLETYANLLLEYHPDWTVEKQLINPEPCRFLPDPSLTIFATGKLGLCCVDLNNTANFGSLSDFPSIVDALNSEPARQIFAELSNGIAVSNGCQICLGTGKKMCG